MDVHLTKNVSIGIDLYPYILLYRFIQIISLENHLGFPWLLKGFPRFFIYIYIHASLSQGERPFYWIYYTWASPHPAILSRAAVCFGDILGACGQTA